MPRKKSLSNCFCTFPTHSPKGVLSYLQVIRSLTYQTQIRLGIQEVMPMNIGDIRVGLQVDVSQLCAGAVL